VIRSTGREYLNPRENSREISSAEIILVVHSTSHSVEIDPSWVSSRDVAIKLYSSPLDLDRVHLKALRLEQSNAELIKVLDRFDPP
jgi:hypothetical protein